MSGDGLMELELRLLQVGEVEETWRQWRTDRLERMIDEKRSLKDASCGNRIQIIMDQELLMVDDGKQHGGKS